MPGNYYIYNRNPNLGNMSRMDDGKFGYNCPDGLFLWKVNR